MNATADLPDDINALKAIILAQQEQNVVQARVINRKETRIIQLEKLVADYKRAMFGARSEKTCPEQYALALEGIEAAQETVHAEDEADDRQVSGNPRPRKINRGSLPKHLPRIEEVIEPQGTICDCGHERHVIGEDVSERLDIIPAQFRVFVTRRPKYACRSCESGIVQASAPAHLIPGGMPTEATLAHVIVSKYADHLPLYRQAQIYSRQSIDLDRSTLAAWVGRTAFELQPVYDALLANLKQSSKLFMDETAAPGRSGQYAETILKGFSGTLQVDGYTGYNRLLKRPDDSLQLAYCWAHARRKLYEVSQTGTTPIADEGLKQIGKLYRVERDIRGLSPDARRAARQERSKPIIDAFEVWLTANRARVSAKSPIGDTLKYIAKYWDGLALFLEDGRFELDSNAVERTIHPIALNRKNPLFAGHDAGAQNWAMIASLIETCKLNAVDPHAWLATTLTAIAQDHKQSNIDALLPWNYKGLTGRQGHEHHRVEDHS